jgi:hypothetical protein
MRTAGSRRVSWSSVWLGYERAGRRPLASDLLQALLRLAPDGRGEALALAGDLRGEWAAAVRWALGGDARSGRAGQEAGALWIAAGRARAPHADLSGPLAALACASTGRMSCARPAIGGKP